MNRFRFFRQGYSSCLTNIILSWLLITIPESWWQEGRTYGQDAPGGRDNVQQDFKPTDIVSNFNQLLNDKSLTCNTLLRDLTIVANKSIGSPWARVKKALESKNLAPYESRPSRLGRVHYYVIKKDVFVASKIHWDLTLDIHVLEPDKGQRAGLKQDSDEEEVQDVHVKLSAQTNMPFEEAARQKGHPKGSVLEFILNSEELKTQGRIWPVMKGITVSYASVVVYASSRSSHAGFQAEVEFIAGKEKEVGGMTFALDIESQLDPPFPEVKDFKPTDRYGRVVANVRKEWWTGDKETQKANKAKYLRSPE